MTTSICARMNPSSGDSTIPSAVFPSPPNTTALKPAFATPAPVNPPISAWLLLDGSPTPHVTRFQTIAPTSAPKMTCASMTPALTMPVPIVSATCSPNTANAMKLKNAAHTTAVLGLRTRVETTVAIEFAASCRPFMKSNASATATSPKRTNVPSATESMRAACLRRASR